MKPERITRRWRRRHARLTAALADLWRRSRRRGEAEEIHQLRVTLRRLRLSVRLGKGWLADDQVARLRTWASQVSRATSPVRDWDIAVEWLRAAQASPGLVQEATRRRDRVWQRRRAGLASLPARLGAGLEPRPPGRKEPAAAGLARRLARLEARYRKRLQEWWPRFFRLGEEDRHEFRRRVRWWRYLLELVLPRRALAKDLRLKRLLAAQEALGEVQNLDLVGAALRRLTPSAEVRELRALLARQQEVQREKGRQALAQLKPVLV